MHWNEKIDLIKKKYSADEFSVPHVNRKEILRKIETKFIKRDTDYYDLNKFNERFCNWYSSLTSEGSIQIDLELEKVLNPIFTPNKKNWIACEFSNQILIYKSSLLPTMDLISIGQRWSDTYHIIDSKFDFLVSFKFDNNKIEIKFSGDNKKIKKIKTYYNTL
jgi:hypothetical protein